jgi:uncharacterized protein (UPF0297 family)
MQTIEQVKRLSEETFLRIYESLAEKGFGPLDQYVAQAMRFRLPAIRRLPIAQRARKAKSMLSATRNAELAYELLGTYLLKEHKDLVTGLLDATGVKHENGLLDGDPTNLPDGSKVGAAVLELEKQHPPEDVTIYLALCAQQWPEVKEIEKLWRERLPH